MSPAVSNASVITSFPIRIPRLRRNPVTVVVTVCALFWYSPTVGGHFETEGNALNPNADSRLIAQIVLNGFQ